MTNEEIISELQPIFHDIFDDKKIVVSEATTADDIEDWDSLSNIRLTVTIEKRFGIKFAFEELKKLENVGEMVALIAKKVS